MKDELSDYKKGWGGQFGIQADRKDKSAVGWDEKAELAKHESQTGQNNLLFSLSSIKMSRLQERMGRAIRYPI